MKKNIIIITGGAGFVGSNLIKKILKFKKYKIISIDNYSSGSNKNHIKDDRTTYIKNDTKNPIDVGIGAGIDILDVSDLIKAHCSFVDALVTVLNAPLKPSIKINPNNNILAFLLSNIKLDINEPIYNDNGIIRMIVFIIPLNSKIPYSIFLFYL